MKVFWVLGWDQYYPAAGLGNVLNTFETREEANEYVKTVSGWDYVEVEDVSRLLGIE